MLSSDKHSFRYVQIYNYYLYITPSKAKNSGFSHFLYLDLRLRATSYKGSNILRLLPVPLLFPYYSLTIGTEL